MIQFAFPSVLWGLLAISIPVIIHLFRLRRFRIVLFSNTKFLREVQLETRKKSRLKYLIILLLRILAIAALVMAFARPFIPVSSNSQGNELPKNVIIYIDNSFSMEAGEAYHSKLDQAKKIALEIVDGFAGGENFYLFSNAFDALSFRPLSKKQIRDAISKLGIHPALQNFRSIMLRLHEIGMLFPAQSALGFIISDFQKSFFAPEHLNDLPDFHLFFIPVDGAPVVNAGIDSLWLDAPVFQKDRPVLVNVRVKNYSNELYENLSVSLYVNDQQRSLTACDLSPGGSAICQLSFTPIESGIYSCYVKIDDAPITYDNTMYFSLTLSDAIKVLAITGKKGLNNSIGAIFRNEPLFEFTVLSIDRLQSGSISSADLVILDAVQNISEIFMSELSEFVNNGGTIAIIPPTGENSISELNAVMSKLKLDTYLPISTAGLRISEIQTGHDLFKGVFDGVPKDMDLPVVKKYYPIRETTSRWRLPLIKMQNGSPFLLVSPVGKGMVYYFTVPFEPEFTDFQKHPIIVPVFYQMAFLSKRQANIQYKIGENNPVMFSGDANNTFQSNTIRIVATNLSREIIPQVKNEGGIISLYIHGMLNEAGNYIIRQNNSDVQGLALNYGREESDMTFYNQNALDSIIQNMNIKNVNILTGSVSLSSDIQQFIQGKQLWKIFLIIALLCIAFEIILLRFWK